ncbi:nucleoside hydrolase [Phenylobacterium sp.]|uniref:nucleoside hydrolase n=1 Tax=Phenylobacterium sp. TaxID=1871053 RepID=UPI002737505C|nr:nucleoside hydrolase [Phenylobacterium sp.]MDP3855817.1 nucleoside hydrolase [Phenylobacterium sp.]
MTKLIIDCDPGVDDAVALFLAFASRDLEILAVTTVGGNVGADLTARNARIIRQIAGREDVPVHAGATRPLVREPVEADHFHGESGLGDLPVFEPDAPLAAAHAVDVIVETVMAAAPGTVTLAVTGPMTNLALAIIREPALAHRLARVVVMGGARTEGGNITPSAEYNIYADPHAAHVVFSSRCPCVVLGLDATHQVRATAGRVAAIRAAGTPAAQAAAGVIDFSNGIERDLVGGRSAPMHDPCVIAYILAPHLFTTRPCGLQVETNSALTLGHTAVEFRLADPSAATVQWVTEVDADGVFGLITERLARS